MEQGKITRKQILKKLNEAQVFVEKAQKGIRFGDIGVGIYVSEDYVTMESVFHYHVWKNIVGDGESRPVTMLKQFVDIALLHLDEIKDKNTQGELFYSFGKLIGIPTLTNTEKLNIVLVMEFIYTNNSTIYAIGYSEFDMTNLHTAYKCWMARADAFMIAGESEHDITQNENYNNIIFRMRANSLAYDIDKDSELLLTEKIKEAETKALEEIKSFIESKGGKLLDNVVLHKDNTNEAQALNELQH